LASEKPENCLSARQKTPVKKTGGDSSSRQKGKKKKRARYVNPSFSLLVKKNCQQPKTRPKLTALEKGGDAGLGRRRGKRGRNYSIMTWKKGGQSLRGGEAGRFQANAQLTKIKGGKRVDKHRTWNKNLKMTCFYKKFHKLGFDKSIEGEERKKE